MLILYIMTSNLEWEEPIELTKHFFAVILCLPVLCCLLCACSSGSLLTEDTFLERYNALDGAQQLQAADALAKEEDAFLGHAYFLSPGEGETYLMTLYINRETTELQACSLLYARLEEAAESPSLAALLSRMTQAFTGEDAQVCEEALKKAGALGTPGSGSASPYEWNGFYLEQEPVAFGWKFTVTRTDGSSLLNGEVALPTSQPAQNSPSSMAAE